MVSEAVGLVTFLLDIFIASGSAELSFNMQQAVQAGKCAVTNLGDNFWQFFAAIYYVAKEFGQEIQIEDAVTEYWPMVCTCKVEMDEIAK